MRYIDAYKLIAEIERYKQVAAIARFDNAGENADYFQGKVDLFDDLMNIITSLQQDETQVDRMLCSQIWWEEQGWIMIPPDATIEGIDSLLKQVRKKLQHEQQKIDLEEELQIFIQNHEDWDDDYELLQDAIRHFYELGFNARKEE